MAKRKIIFDNWIAENGAERDLSFWQEYLIQPPDRRITADTVEAENESNDTSDNTTFRLRAEVRSAVARLTEEERELIERIHFMGESIQEIAEKSGRRRHSIEALHRRCVRKLIKYLSPFVSSLWSVGRPPRAQCAICASPLRQDIDTIIASRDKTRTWKPVLAEIRKRFGIQNVTAQLLKGHEQYH